MLGSTEAIIALQKPADTLSPIVQPTLLDRVLLYEEDEGCMAMGPLAARLRAFSDSIDRTHPGLQLLFDGQLVSNEAGSFSRDVSDILSLARIAQSQEMSHTVLDNLKRVTRANKFFREINRVIDSPFKNQLHVRFLYKYAHRAEIHQICANHKLETAAEPGSSVLERATILF